MLRALRDGREAIAARYGFVPSLVAAARGRDGLVHDPGGLDPAAVLALVEGGGSLPEIAAADHTDDVAEGLGGIEADVLAVVCSSPPPHGEPGLTYIRGALERGIGVATSDKWPVALHGVELVEVARRTGAAFRAESTVMSGTPVLGTLLDGLAGARPTALRGVLNATANFILTAIAAGSTPERALAAAREAGLAERDPSADLDGHDSVAKAMILAALVLGAQLEIEDVARTGIAGVDPAELRSAAADGGAIRLVESIVPDAGRPAGVRAEVLPQRLTADDPLAAIEGAENALVCAVEPLGEIRIAGPGAGPALAGQGVLSDLIAVGRAAADKRTARRGRAVA